VKLEVVGEIEQVETIAVGPSVKVRKFLGRPTVGAGGGNEKGSPQSGSQMEISVESSYMGTKPTVSVNGT
jgi:hypothetical protein